jgi:tetratricopeptide (TPR) repeat protein
MIKAVKPAIALLIWVALGATPSIARDWEKAISLYKQGQYRAAIAEFQGVTAESPNHADSWKYIGLSYYQLQEYSQAIAPLEKALSLKQAEGASDLDLPVALGRVHIALKQFDKALPYLESLTKQRPNIGANYYALGVAYAGLNRVEDAAAAFRTAAKLDPKDGDSWYYLGVEQFRSGKLDEAIVSLRTGAVSSPKHAEMLGLLAEALLRRGAVEESEARAKLLFDEAVKAATTLRALRDDSPSAELLGRAYLAAKKYPKAEELLERALATTKEPTPVLYFNLGFAAAQNKNWSRSADMLALADKLKPADVNTLAYLGYVYENLRRYPQALDAYTRAYETGGRTNTELKASIDRVTPFARPQ